jgi:hypothetical protein
VKNEMANGIIDPFGKDICGVFYDKKLVTKFGLGVYQEVVFLTPFSKNLPILDKQEK